MALLQDILSQLTDMNILEQGQGWGDIADVSPASIAGALQNYYGITSENLPPHLFQGISSDILQQGLQKKYSPQIEATGQTLLTNLQSTMGGQKGKQAIGGFAGSGQASRFQQGARDVYGKEMAGALSQVGQQRIQGLQSVQDIINQWRETAAGIQY